MNLSEFKHKLAQCNKDLYVDTNHRIYTVLPRGSSGIYCRSKRDMPIDLSGVYGQERVEAVRLNESQDKYIGWTPHEYLSDGDEFDLEKERFLAPGWRSIVRRFVASNYFDADTAYKNFGWVESTYDRLNNTEKLEWEKKQESNKLCLQQ